MTTNQARERGRKGGKATVEKYGREHMKRIGRDGAAAFHEKYTYEPYGTSDFAIVERATGRLTGKTINGRTLRTLFE